MSGTGIPNRQQLEKDVLEMELEHAKLPEMQQAIQWRATDIIETTQEIEKITASYWPVYQNMRLLRRAIINLRELSSKLPRNRKIFD